MCELMLDVMDSVGTDSFSFCYNDILLLLVHSQVKAERHQVRKVLQECWKLTPASNTLTYTTYQVDFTRECRYSPIRRIGRFYTVTKEYLTSLWLFWWNDEEVYNHTETYRFTSSSDVHQKYSDDEKRKKVRQTMHDNANDEFFFWRVLWWKDDECVFCCYSIKWYAYSSNHRFFIHH